MRVHGDGRHQASAVLNRLRGTSEHRWSRVTVCRYVADVRSGSLVDLLHLTSRWVKIVVLSSDLGKQCRSMLSVDWGPDRRGVDGLWRCVGEI